VALMGGEVSGIICPPSSRRGIPLERSDLARKIVDLLSDRQAEDVVLLDISKVAAFADYFVIASAANVRQMQALLEAVEEGLGRDGIRTSKTEGELDSGWILLDLGDIVVHLFSPAERAYYDIERLWSKGTEVVRMQ
jgi:ribosome-associated protein